jgi:hypothetical protein
MYVTGKKFSGIIKTLTAVAMDKTMIAQYQTVFFFDWTYL